jgi:protein-disulfide isomerase
MASPGSATSGRIPRWAIVATIAVAVIVVAILVAISASGGDDTASADDLRFVDEVSAQFAGIPQEGTRLGEPDAPVEIVEYADLQCPFCAQAAQQVLPELLTRYVRTGKARMTFRPMAFIGPDSERGALGALAAGEQGALWTYTELLYRNQGAENSGWLSDDVARGAATALGLDTAAFDTAREGDTARQALAASTATAQAEGVNSTPTFVVIGPKGRIVIEDFRNLGEFQAAVTGLV